MSLAPLASLAQHALKYKNFLSEFDQCCCESGWLSKSFFSHALAGLFLEQKPPYTFTFFMLWCVKRSRNLEETITASSVCKGALNISSTYGLTSHSSWVRNLAVSYKIASLINTIYPFTQKRGYPLHLSRVRAKVVKNFKQHVLPSCGLLALDVLGRLYRGI